MMPTLNLSLLAYDSPILRAYLAVFKELNIKLDKIEVVLFNKLPGHKKKLMGSYFPSPFNRVLLKNSMHNLMNFYPRILKKKYKDFYKSISADLQKRHTFSQEFLSSFDNSINYNEFANSVSYMNIDSYKDTKFINFINEIDKKIVFLYSGGGILPLAAFKNPLVRYLHVHPGYLPFVRGSDCYLWSLLLNNKIGATSFFMSPEIDEGNILLAQQFMPVSININKKDVINSKDLYRIIYSYFDPCLRAEVLKHTLQNFDNFDNVEGISQSPLEGETFYFMNDFLKNIAFKKIFNDVKVDNRG